MPTKADNLKKFVEFLEKTNPKSSEKIMEKADKLKLKVVVSGISTFRYAKIDDKGNLEKDRKGNLKLKMYREIVDSDGRVVWTNEEHLAKVGFEAFRVYVKSDDPKYKKEIKKHIENEINKLGYVKFRKLYPDWEILRQGFEKIWSSSNPTPEEIEDASISKFIKEHQ